MRKILTISFILVIIMLMFAACGQTPDTDTDTNIDTSATDDQYGAFFNTNDITKISDNQYSITVPNSLTLFDFSTVLRPEIEVFTDPAGTQIIYSRLSNINEGDNTFFIFNGERTIQLIIHRNKMCKYVIKGTSTQYFEEGTVILDAPTYTPNAGYQFLGWRHEYKHEDITFPYTITEDTFICPKTEVIQCNFTAVNGLDGKSDIQTDTVTAISRTLSVPITTIPVGYKLVGYHTETKCFDLSTPISQGDTTAYIKLDDIALYYDNETFYAIYEPLQYKVYCYDFEWDISIVDITMDLSTLFLPEPDGLPSKAGYEFVGYEVAYTDKNGDYHHEYIGKTTTLPVSSVSELYSNTSYGIGIYAKYTEIERKFTLSMQSGVQCMTSTYIWNKYDIADLPQPTREGYVFEGWFINYGETFTDQYKFDPYTFDPENNRYSETLIACWSSIDADLFDYTLNNKQDRVIITDYKLKNTSTMPNIPTIYRNYSVERNNYFLSGALLIQDLEIAYVSFAPFDFEPPVYDGTFSFGEVETAFGKAWYFNNSNMLSTYYDATCRNPDGTYATWVYKTKTLTIYNADGSINITYTL
jgi:hypothetical protein